MGKKGPKAYPNAIKHLLGRAEKGVFTNRKGHGLTRKHSMLKRYKKM